MKNYIEIWNERNEEIPIIVSIPHSGTYIPSVMKNKLIDNVVLANQDWYLDKLYSFLKELGITTIINKVSRYVIDANRDIIDSDDKTYTNNYIYTKTTFGLEMYKMNLDYEDIKSRISNYYLPYHQTVSKIIDTKLKRFNKIYLIDLHSFGKCVDENIVLGNGDGKTTSKDFLLLVKNLLEKRNFKISLNKPYSGGYITKKYASDKVETIQIELKYNKYIEDRIFENEEFPKINGELFNLTQKELKHFFEELKNSLRVDIKQDTFDEETYE